MIDVKTEDPFLIGSSGKVRYKMREVCLYNSLLAVDLPLWPGGSSALLPQVVQERSGVLQDHANPLQPLCRSSDLPCPRGEGRPSSVWPAPALPLQHHQAVRRQVQVRGDGVRPLLDGSPLGGGQSVVPASGSWNTRSQSLVLSGGEDLGWMLHYSVSPRTRTILVRQREQHRPGPRPRHQPPPEQHPPRPHRLGVHVGNEWSKEVLQGIFSLQIVWAMQEVKPICLFE